MSWALHSTHAGGPGVLPTVFFVLFLAVIGESTVLVVVTSTLVSTRKSTSRRRALLMRQSAAHLLLLHRGVVLPGYVISEIKRERQREADKGFAWAKRVEAMVCLHGRAVEAV